MQMASTAIKQKTAVKRGNGVPAGRWNVRSYEEAEPDDWDMALLGEAERENDGSVISLEQLAEDLGVAL